MHRQDHWQRRREPSIDELLSDPIALALLRSDGLTRRGTEAVLERAQEALRRRRGIAVAPLPPEWDFDAEPELMLVPVPAEG